MKSFFLAAAALVLFPISALAQECVNSQQTALTIKTGEPVAVGWCTTPTRDAGWLNNNPSKGYQLFINGMQQTSPGPVTGVLQANGETFWSTPRTIIINSAGTYLIQVKLVNATGAGAAAPPAPIVMTVENQAPVPVDCQVSGWTAWSDWTPWTPISTTTETRTQTRTRTVITSPTNGGAACPTLVETNTETRPITAIDPACAAPLGAEAASVFVTRFDQTTKAPGSKMRLNYQLASKSPIIEVRAKMNGAVVAVTRATGPGDTLNADGGIWFTQPGPGTYKLSVWVKNQYGCTRETAAPTDLIVR